LLTGFGYAHSLSAQSQADSPTLQVSVKNEEFIGNTNERQVQRVYVTFGTNEFAFTLPEGFRADASNPQKIVLSDADYTCFITFRFLDPKSGGVREVSAGSCRTQVLSRFPGATITNERSEFVGNHSGPAFDLQWKNSAGTEQSARVAYAPSSIGVVEFSLLASSNRFDDCRVYFSMLLASFRSNEDGKLRITPVSDKS
jgi:hypothetical protein